MLHQVKASAWATCFRVTSPWWNNHLYISMVLCVYFKVSIFHSIRLAPVFLYHGFELARTRSITHCWGGGAAAPWALTCYVCSWNVTFYTMILYDWNVASIDARFHIMDQWDNHNGWLVTTWMKGGYLQECTQEMFTQVYMLWVNAKHHQDIRITYLITMNWANRWAADQHGEKLSSTHSMQYETAQAAPHDSHESS